MHETGKPLPGAYGEIGHSLGFTWWFAGEAELIQEPSSPRRLQTGRVLVVKQPLGVAVALVPWNFPVAMILRKAGPAFAAGCTMMVKPSPEGVFGWPCSVMLECGDSWQSEQAREECVHTKSPSPSA